MYGTFSGCTSLTTAPVIPATVTTLERAFYGCTSLTAAPVIPASVTTLQSAFTNCTALTTAPVIPATVKNLYSAFSGCTSLTGTIQINASLNEGYVDCAPAKCTKCFKEGYECATCPDCAMYSYCFKGTVQPITLTGTCEKLAELAATGANGNVVVG